MYRFVATLAGVDGVDLSDKRLNLIRRMRKSLKKKGEGWLWMDLQMTLPISGV